MRWRVFIPACLLLVALGGPAGANLVANPGFETGDFTNWSVTGDGISIDSVFPNTGNFDAAFSAVIGDPSAGVLSQALSTSGAASYTLSFALLDESGLSDDSFAVQFGGFATTITGDMAAPPGTLPSTYTAFIFVVPGADIAGASTTLSFEGLVDPISGSDWNLDDVSVVGASSVPEPGAWILLLIGFAATAATRTSKRVEARRAVLRWMGHAVSTERSR